MAATYEDIMSYMGGFNLFTVISVICMGFLSIYMCLTNFSSNFLWPHLEHWCRVPKLEELPQARQRYLVSPHGGGCDTYDVPWQNFTDEEIGTWNWSQVDTSEYELVPCDGWVYDNDPFNQPTVTSEWDLVCDKEVIWALISPIYMTGLLMGSLTSGPIADRFGRLRGILIFLIVHIAARCVCIFSVNEWMYIVGRALLGMATRGANIGAIVLLMELTVSRYRAQAVIANRMMYTSGILICSGLAYGVRHFRHYQFVLLVPIILMLSYYWIFPESPRWLISNGRYKDAQEAICKLARRYRRTVPANIVEEYAYQKSKQAGSGDKPVKPERSGTKDLFIHPVIRRYTLIIAYTKISAQFVYFAVSMNMGEQVGDIYVNTLAAGVIELPSLLVLVWATQRLGRRLTLIICFAISALTGALSIAFLILPGLDFGATLALIVCRSAAGCCVATTTTYTGELFPTPFRQTAVGVTSAFAAVISILAPVVGGPLTDVWQPLPNIIFTVLVSIAVVLVFFLPETLNQRLPETTEDAANLMTGDVGRPRLNAVPIGMISRPGSRKTSTITDPGIIMVPVPATELYTALSAHTVNSSRQAIPDITASSNGMIGRDHVDPRPTILQQDADSTRSDDSYDLPTQDENGIHNRGFTPDDEDISTQL